MEINKFTYSEKLPAVRENFLALDLEMANSFRSGHSVICMAGIEYYSPSSEKCYSSIVSTTHRNEEKDLMVWLLDQLELFYGNNKEPKLLSFSGIDNDIRWLNERLSRLEIGSPEDSILKKFGHLDLRFEFFKRTLTDRISLKKMEEIFGIERDSSISSKKVSYILTDLVKKENSEAPIPEKLFNYLREDVHNLFLIYNKWNDVSLNQYNMTELEYHDLLVSLVNTIRKFLNSKRIKGGRKKSLEHLRTFQELLQDALEKTLQSETFIHFNLPEFPELAFNHPELERIKKKHGFLDSLKLSDADTGAYRLRNGFFKPQGALAVVRNEESILMIRRSQTVEYSAGCWGLPGGVVEKGESPADCALRELQEEVNLHGNIKKILGSTESFNGDFNLTWVEIKVDDASTLKPNPLEVGEARWVTPEEIQSLEPLIPGAMESFATILGLKWGGRKRS